MVNKSRYKLHPNFPRYRFYDDGRVQSILKEIENRDGTFRDNPHYLKFLKVRKHARWDLLMISLLDINGIQQTVYPHIMTATLFVPKSKKNRGKKHVWFHDNDKTNVHYTNLYWVDHGDLNFIQQALGRRDMAKQAAIMRKKRKNIGRPRIK